MEKVCDVVGLYVNPPEKTRALVLCLDEKSQVQVLERTRPLLPLRPDQPERRTHDPVRHGATSLFAALDTATGKVIGQCHRRHRHQEFLSFLRRIDKEVPPDLEIHPAMDNYATHKTPKWRHGSGSGPAIISISRPPAPHGLGQVERWFAKITEQRIRRSAFRSVAELEKAIHDYIEENNRSPKPFVWTATAGLILGKVKTVYERINQSSH